MPITTPQKKLGGSGCLLLFGLPFLAVGIGASWILISQLLQLHQMQSWPEIPAYISESSLKTHRSSKSTTYTVKAEYTYIYQDRRYQSQRVSIDIGSDNVDSFAQEAASELAQYRGQERPFRCYVNPDDPTQAVLYREPRPGMLAFIAVFAVMFGAVGGGIVLAAWWPTKAPPEPGQEAWRQGRLTTSDQSSALGLGLFTLLWNGLSAPIPLLIGEQLYVQLLAGKLSVLLLLIFPLIGLLLLISAGYLLLRWQKFGQVTLVSTALPVPPGGRLNGTLELAGRIEPPAGFVLVLQCLERITTGSGKKRSTQEKTLWEATHNVPSSPFGNRGQTRIPVDFTLPTDAAPTQSDPHHSILWRLQASAQVPGVDFHCQFEIPVQHKASGPK